MRRLSVATQGLRAALVRRYRNIEPASIRGRILDEFVAIAGLHRKRSIRLLRCDPDGADNGRGNRAPSLSLRNSMNSRPWWRSLAMGGP